MEINKNEIIANISHKFMVNDLTLTREEADDYYSLDSTCIMWKDESGSYINIKGLCKFKINDDKEDKNLFERSMQKKS